MADYLNGLLATSSVQPPPKVRSDVNARGNGEELWNLFMRRAHIKRRLSALRKKAADNVELSVCCDSRIEFAAIGSGEKERLKCIYVSRFTESIKESLSPTQMTLLASIFGDPPEKSCAIGCFDWRDYDAIKECFYCSIGAMLVGEKSALGALKFDGANPKYDVCGTVGEFFRAPSRFSTIKSDFFGEKIVDGTPLADLFGRIIEIENQCVRHVLECLMGDDFKVSKTTNCPSNGMSLAASIEKIVEEAGKDQTSPLIPDKYRDGIVDSLRKCDTFHAAFHGPLLRSTPACEAAEVMPTAPAHDFAGFDALKFLEGAIFDPLPRPCKCSTGTYRSTAAILASGCSTIDGQKIFIKGKQVISIFYCKFEANDEDAFEDEYSAEILQGFLGNIPQLSGIAVRKSVNCGGNGKRLWDMFAQLNGLRIAALSAYDRMCGFAKDVARNAGLVGPGVLDGIDAALKPNFMERFRQICDDRLTSEHKTLLANVFSQDVGCGDYVWANVKYIIENSIYCAIDCIFSGKSKEDIRHMELYSEYDSGASIRDIVSNSAEINPDYGDVVPGSGTDLSTLFARLIEFGIECALNVADYAMGGDFRVDGTGFGLGSDVPLVDVVEAAKKRRNAGDTTVFLGQVRIGSMDAVGEYVAAREKFEKTVLPAELHSAAMAVLVAGD
ncbi:MAG: hypothetical protein LBB38_01605 [Puniceicoccales bacterium]|nr:hypothetical protein [Puniceicoccales bacterium]